MFFSIQQQPAVVSEVHDSDLRHLINAACCNAVQICCIHTAANLRLLESTNTCVHTRGTSRPNFKSSQ